VHSVDFRLHVSVVVIIASMSVSKGLACRELAGVEMSDVLGTTWLFSAVGVAGSDANVSWEGFWTRRVDVVSTVKPTFSGGVMDAMAGQCEC
jgi:hypothetical protein